MNRRLRMAGESAARGTILALAVSLIPGIDLASPAIAQCQYEISAIVTAPPCPFSGPPYLIGQGMNSNGDIVGRYGKCDASGDEAFYWSPKTGLITLPRPKGVTSAIAYDVNDHGIIVGWHCIGNGCNAGRGFVYDINRPGEFTYLEPLHGVGGSTFRAISNNGLAVGSRSIGKPGQNPNPYNAVIWNTKTGEITDLGVIDGPNSQILDISEAGDVAVGWDGWNTPSTIAYVWQNGRPVALGPIPGGDTSNSSAVNAHGLIVGTGWNLSTLILRGFYWEEGEMQIIEPLSGYTSSSAGWVNDSGQILVLSSSGAFLQMGGLWQHGEMSAIPSLVLPGTGAIVRRPQGINNAGQILTEGQHNGLVGSLLLTPVNRPLTDFDINCRTDVHDLMILLDQWGGGLQGEGAGPNVDLNNDGIVNAVDLLILLSNWG